MLRVIKILFFSKEKKREGRYINQKVSMLTQKRDRDCHWKCRKDAAKKTDYTKNRQKRSCYERKVWEKHED